MVSDKQLKHWYDKYNRTYFNGQLPSDTVIWWEPSPGNDAVTCPVYEVRDGKFEIRMDPIAKILPWAWRILLLHEMVHVKVWAKHPRHQHGKVFQDEMKRLVELGAFKNLW